MTWKRRVAPGLTAAHWWATGATNSLCGLVTSAGTWEATDAPGCGKCEEKIRRSNAMLAKLVPEAAAATASPSKPWQIAKAIGIDAGCGDNSCLWGSPGGMATNGGCRCAEKGADAHAAWLELRKALRVLRHVLEQTKWRIS